MKVRTSIRAALFAALIFPFTIPSGTCQEAGDKLEIGGEVPDFTATDAGGKEVKLSAFRKSEGNSGKVVAVVFWSFECPTGKKYMEKFGEFARWAEEQGAVALFVASYGEKDEKIKEYVEENKIVYSVVLDPEQKICQGLKAKTVTQSFLVDSEGKLAYRGAFESQKGKPPTPHLRQAVEQLVKGEKVDPAETKNFG